MYSIDNTRVLKGIKFKVEFEEHYRAITPDIENTEYTISDIIDGEALLIKWVNINGVPQIARYSIKNAINYLNEGTWISLKRQRKEKLEQLNKNEKN